MKKLIAIVISLAMSAAMLTGCGNTAEGETVQTEQAISSSEDRETTGKSDDKDKITIGFSVKTMSEERWQREVENLQAECDKVGAELMVQVANQESDKQISQIENMITAGVDVIMVCAVDDGALGNVLNDAHEQGILIVSYDDMLSNTWCDAYVGYDPYQVGLAISSQACKEARKGNYVFLYGDKGSGITVTQFATGMKDALKPLFDDGTATMVMEQYCTDWKAENAMAHVENALSTYGNDIAAVICMNDGTASGAIQALEAAGLAGQVVVTGMDGELTACQRIVEGTQTSTVFKNTKNLSAAAIKLCVDLVQGNDYEYDATQTFGINEFPWVKVGFDVVTKENMDQVMIDTGVFTHQEVYGE